MKISSRSNENSYYFWVRAMFNMSQTGGLNVINFTSRPMPCDTARVTGILLNYLNYSIVHRNTGIIIYSHVNPHSRICPYDKKTRVRSIALLSSILLSQLDVQPTYVFTQYNISADKNLLRNVFIAWFSPPNSLFNLVSHVLTK